MWLKFRTWLSSSEGNSSLILTPEGGLIMDFSPGDYDTCIRCIRQMKRHCGKIYGAFITHAHSDHIHANALAALYEEGIKVITHVKTLKKIKKRYGGEYLLKIAKPYKTDRVRTGVFNIRTFEVPHREGYYTRSAIVTVKSGAKTFKISYFTDLSRFSDEYIFAAKNSDIIYVESNYDVKMNKEAGHFGSQFHLSNTQAADFLSQIMSSSKNTPQHVILGHVSQNSNKKHLPEKEVKRVF